MPKPLTTLQILPAGDMGRFASMPLGADRIAALRDEFLALRRVVALVHGVLPEALTLDDVAHITDVVLARAALNTKARFDGFSTSATSGDLRDAILWTLAEQLVKSAAE